MKKSIFLFFAAILCATNAWGAKLFFDCSSVNYPADGALVAIWSWGGSSSDAWSVFKASGATNKIVADIADGRTGGKIVRFNSSVTKPDWSASQWNSTGDISFPKDKNCIKITKWDGATSGTWSTFQLDSKASVTPSASSVSVGEEVTFTPALTSNQEYNDVLSTTYSVGAGATITSGKFVATEAGTYTVTATVTYNAQGYTNITKTATATCEIVVSEVVVPHPVTGVTVAPASVTIKQGATTTLTATIAPSNADDPSVTWSSDNESVATVVNGVVTAVAAGTANITVTTVDGGFTATCAVKVKPLQYTFYAINSAEWPTVAAHYWGGADGGSVWPGADMVKESETINGFDIYSITISSDFINIMFTNQLNGDDKNKKTADLTTEGNDGKYYIHNYNGNTGWYTKAEAEAILVVPVEYDYVYFINTNSWAAVNIYTWTSEIATWPGVAMNKEAEQIAGFDVYSHKEVKGTSFGGMKFNEGKDKKETGNLTWQAGKYYAPSKDKWYDTKEAAAEALATPLADETVYFVNNKKWASVAIYGWGGTASTSEGIGKWAGADMTKTAEQVAGFDVYSYTAKEGTVKNILFNYNGDENKTSDFVWTNGKYYYMDAGAQKDKNYTGGTKEEVAEIVAIPVVDNYYVSGTFNSWASNDAAKLTLNDGLYTKELTLEAGAHMFKVQKNNWAGEWGYSNIKGAYVGMEEGTNDDGDKNNNIKLTLSTKTTFTVKFNLADNEITFDGLTEDETETLVYTVEVPEGTEKCYIAGKMNNWEFALMTQKDATHWTITYDNVLKDMEYKYACQASWDYVEKDKDGNDLADNRTWKENDKVEKWGKPVVVTYQLKGVGGWDQPGIELVQNPGNDKEYMLTCQAISATDAIKVVRLEDGVIKDYYGNGTVKDEVTVTVSYDGEANIKLPEGKYNFYFDTNASEKKLWIEAATDCVTEPTPDYIRTGLTDGQWGTLCPDQKVTDMQGASFYTLTYLEMKDGMPYQLFFDEITTDYLEAGKPYLFIAEGEEIKGVKSGEVVTIAYNYNGFCGNVSGNTISLATTQTEYVADGDVVNYYGVINSRFTLLGNGTTVAHERAYVQIKNGQLDCPNPPASLPALAPGARRVVAGATGINTATGVDQVEGDEVPTKMIINGQLYILRGEKMYDAQGKLVK